MNRIYVTGHRNPDTDSIAAAISYAALRNALGNRDYVAAHLGHISDETKRLLDRFGFQEPVTISNVRTQVRDLDFDTPPALNSSGTMDRAWHIMRDQNISAMPIINEDGTLCNDPEKLAAMNEGTTMWSPYMKSSVFSDWAVEDGSFLRLSTLTLGYTLPQRIRVEGVEKSTNVSFRVRRICGKSTILVKSGDQVIAKFKRERLAPGEMEHIALPRVLLDKAPVDELTIEIEEA